jgi:hypothetical protein
VEKFFTREEDRGLRIEGGGKDAGAAVRPKGQVEVEVEVEGKEVGGGR